MRGLDPDPRPFRPLGEKVVQPPAAKPEWRPAPSGTPGVQIGPDGRLRTNLPLPKDKP